MTTHELAYPSPIGPLRLVAEDDALVALHLPNANPPAAASRAGETPAAPVLVRAREQLDAYFAGERETFDLPLAPRGTAFQRSVWRALLAVPFGVTCSYGDIAKAVGRPKASRAVGAANGQNPIAIVVPCHRVIGANGTLTGYGGGLPLKEWLLRHEQRAKSRGKSGRIV
jgi:methylated-DNA-[protein]-cysteine S-methyltransferase